MHTYRKDPDSIRDAWLVGYWLTWGGTMPQWETVSSHKTEREAILRVNFLNGGERI